MATATLKAKLTLGITQFQANMQKAVALAKKHGDKIRDALDERISGGIKRGFAAGGIAAGLAGAGLAKGIKGAYDMGGALSDLMSKTSGAGETLQALSLAMRDAGLDASAAGDVINRMQKAVSGAAKGNKEFAAVFRELGLDIKTLKGLRPEAQFKAIGDAINNMADPADRLAASMKLFRGSGGDLLTLFADGNALDSAAKTLGSQAKILAANAADFDTVSDRLGHVGEKLNGFFVGAASTFLPAMLALTSAMERADFGKQGEQFGQSMQRAAELFAGVFSDPSKLFGATKDYLISMFLEIANQFVHFVEMAFKGIIGEIIASFNHIAAAIVAAAEKAAEYLPGNTTRSDAQKRAGEHGAREADLRRRSQQYVAEGDHQRAEEMAALANKELLAKNRQLKIARGEVTMAERIAEIKKRDGIENYAQGLRGNKDNLFGIAPDRFGAGRYANRSRVQIGQLRQAGARSFGEMMGPPDLREKNPFAAFTTMGFGASGLGSSGGLTSGGLGAAYNKIRRGDEARAKASAVKDPAEKTNDLLTDIKSTIQNAWGT